MSDLPSFVGAPSSDGGGSRQTSLIVLANGVPLAAALSADVASNNHHAADTFAVSAALANAQDAAMWANTVPLAIEIRVSLNGGTPISLIQGNADRIEIDAIRGLVHIEGRDATALMIAARTQETFANRTASEIVTIIAGRHSLAANVTSTTTPVGRYWQLDHDSITLNQFSRATTEWDLLTSLAAREGYDVWVSGTTLNFQPSAMLRPASVPILTLQATATQAGPPNVTSLKLERSQPLAGLVTVTVKSWQSRQRNCVIETASNNSTAADSPQAYIFVVPNLMPATAQQMATTKLAELTSHERSVVADMPGERWRREGGGN
jgi:hypothetical protein